MNTVTTSGQSYMGAHVHNNERKTKVTYIGNALSIPGTHKRASVKGFVSLRPQPGPGTENDN